MIPAVFFDRDGVLNEEGAGYVHTREEFFWTEGAKDAIRLANRTGCYVFVVTNQSGVARGYYTREDVLALHAFMQAELAAVGAWIDAFYTCFHHPDLTGPCVCRKPQPGLILQAMAEYPVDKSRSLLIGDRERDIKAAQNAGIPGYLYQGGSILELLERVIIPI